MTTVDGAPRAAQAGRGHDQKRYKYEASNIRLKVWVDDHGIFNGSDEYVEAVPTTTTTTTHYFTTTLLLLTNPPLRYAAKGGGHELRGSREFLKLCPAGVRVPMQATIDVAGFRVVACAKMPLLNVDMSDTGEIHSSKEIMVLGTADRGKHIAKRLGREIDGHLRDVSKRLNLAKHCVKGEEELTVKEIWTSVDLRVFKKDDGTHDLVNFWRCFPGEDPFATAHLAQEPRAQSIFWRMLRPELVRTHPEPL